MNSGVCLITNNHNGNNKRNEIFGEGVFTVEKKRFTIEGIFTLSKEVEQYIGVISFCIQDIFYGSNNEMLLFSYKFDYKPLGKNKKILAGSLRDIFYLKMKTGLNHEEEKFLRDYNRMQNYEKQKYQLKFLDLQEKIQKNIIEERERIMYLLNNEKGYGGDLELF